jgi:hypothetical protein
MKGLISRNNLLVAMTFLLVIRFLVVPVYSWQQDQLFSLKLKTQQLSKYRFLIASQGERQAKKSYYEDLLDRAAGISFTDQDDVKLQIQKQIETIFDDNSVTAERFDWILDSRGAVRELRASVQFKGSSANVIKTFWDLSRHPKLMRQLDWKFRFKSASSKRLGSASGSIVLEFYALPQNYAAEEQRAALVTVGHDQESEL